MHRAFGRHDPSPALPKGKGESFSLGALVAQLHFAVIWDTHPRPFPKGRENPLSEVSFIIVNAQISQTSLREKESPFPLGRAGDGFINTTTTLKCTTTGLSEKESPFPLGRAGDGSVSQQTKLHFAHWTTAKRCASAVRINILIFAHKTSTQITMKKHLTLALVLLTLICSSAHAQLPSYLPADGLVGWWPFNGNANDESGNGNDGVVNGGVSLASDRYGNANCAFSFPGNSSSYIQCGNNPSLQILNEITLSAWFYRDGGYIGPRILSYEGSFHTGYGISVSNNSNGMGTLDALFVNGNGNGMGFCCGDGGNGIDVPALSWHNVVFTADLNNIGRLYLDGQLAAEMSGVPVNQANYINSLNIGRLSQSAFDAWGGLLDDIAIYNRALSSQEIQNLYTGTTPAACLDLPANLQDGLVGYWPFCGNANDESGNGNNGTVNGATLAEDRFGNAGSAYSFDGVDNHIDIPFSDLWRGIEASVSVWIRKGNDFEGQRLVLGQSNGRPQLVCNSDYTPGVDNAAFQFKRSSPGFTYVSGNSSILSEEWVNLIGVYTPGSIAIYVDGVLDNSMLQNDLFDNCSQTPLQVGAFNTNGSCGDALGITQAFFGLIDDITIYNRALSPEEVTQLYAVQSTGDPTAGGGGNTTGPLANVPHGISYQAVARDAQGQAIVSSPINVRFTLHQGTPTGTTEYSETHALTTSEIGLFSTYFGSGTAITSAFDSIVWSNTTKFLQVEIDLGNGYVDMGTQQLMSVPFAYRANEAAAAGTIRNNALPVYADNAAALAGGLAVGEMYRTATGDLKVVY